ARHTRSPRARTLSPPGTMPARLLFCPDRSRGSGRRPVGGRVLATFDISNTRIKAGIFDGPELRATFSLAADVRRTADEYAVLLDGLLREEPLQRRDVHGVAIASVVPPLTGIFEHVCSRLFRQQ